jgi:DNA-binding transcriptional ArsR family regulator
VATYLERAFEALGDPTRLVIFQKIASRAQSVGELAEGLPVSRPAVSQHLRVLKQAGLVDADQDGTRRVYRVRPKGIEALRQYFDDLWSRNLEALKATGERRGSDDIRSSSNRASKKVH